MAKNKDSGDDKAAEAKAKGGKAKASKDKGGKGKGGKGKGKGGNDETAYSSIATHPRARAAVRRAKGWAGLAGFGIAAALSLKASVPLVQVGLRALGAGLAGYMLGWWVSVLVWRQLMIAEQRALFEEIKRRRTEETENTGRAEAQVTG
jgi:hypothetical protein